MDIDQQKRSNREKSFVSAKLIDVSAADVTLSPPCAAFRVGTTAGDVEVITAAGDTVVIEDVQKGETVHISVSKFLNSGTGAAGITALF